jgi:hypothetical protein
MLELIVFAQDKEEDLWFAWKASELLNGNETVYCFVRRAKAPQMIPNYFVSVLHRFFPMIG